MRPGPMVAATAESSLGAVAARARASPTTGPISSKCARLAISGTTPPKSAWMPVWLLTTEDRTR